MGKIKIHEIAKELGLTSKEIIEKASSNVGGASGVCRCPGANPGACLGCISAPYFYTSFTVDRIVSGFFMPKFKQGG